MEFVGVDIGAEDIARHLLVFAQQRRAGEADKDRMTQPALHLLVHVAALRAVAFIDKYVKLAMHRRWLALQVRGIEFMNERTQQPGRRVAELAHELSP